MEPKAPSERSTRVTLRAFALIGTIIALTEVAAVYSAVASRDRVRRIVTTALSRVELVSRMGSAIDHERILVDAHIFEQGAADMSNIESRIAEARHTYERSARAYRSIQGHNGIPAESLEGLTESGIAVQQEVDRVVGLSRANRDLEARAGLVRLDSHFDTLQHSLEELIRSNEVDSADAMRQASAVQLGSIAVSTLFALGAIVACIALGSWASRVVAENEAQAVRHARDLETRNRDLDAFAGRVAHDLRGPLTTIGLAGAQLAGVAPNETGAAQILSRGVARMEALIGDLLALSRVVPEAGHGVCDPAEIAASVAEDLAPHADRSGVVVRYDIAPATIACTPVLFRQVLSNLVENGVKYRRSGTDATVSARGLVSGSREYVLTVTDNGLGMERDVLEKIFEPFFRSPRVGHVKGTGLGLSIVKRIVDATGGSISVESVPGRGTTFVVRFGLASSPGSAAR